MPEEKTPKTDNKLEGRIKQLEKDVEILKACFGDGFDKKAKEMK